MKPDQNSPDQGWTVIAQFRSEQEAAIAAGMLENNGIPAQLTGTVMASVYPMTDTWAPVSLLVPASHAPHAKKLLQAHA